MPIIRELIAVAVFVAGFGSEAFCQVQALDAEVYREGIREATEAYRGDVYNVVKSHMIDMAELFSHIAKGSGDMAAAQSYVGK